ncbi:MAG: helicase-associated domain-containing protein [Chloroflexota bacterium]
MPNLDSLRESDIQQVVNASSLRKAKGYRRRVSQGVRQGANLKARIEGNRRYSVEIEVDETGIHADCSCPYNWGGYCKHIGAVLLKWIEDKSAFMVETTDAIQTPAANKYPIKTYPVQPPPTQTPVEKPLWLRESLADRCRVNLNRFEGRLREYKLQELRAIAKRQGWRIKGTRKDDVIQQLIEKMVGSDESAKTFANLDEEHLRVLQLTGVLGRGIRLTESEFEKIILHQGALKEHRQVATYSSNLNEMGLTFPDSFTVYSAGSPPFVPPEIMRQLPPLFAPPEVDISDEAVVKQANPGGLVQGAMQLLLLLEQLPVALRQPMPRPNLERFHAILQGWDYFPEELADPKVVKKLSGQHVKFHLGVPLPAPALPDSAVERLAPLVGGEAQLDFLYHLLVAVGLLQPGSPVTVWSVVKEPFLRQETAVQAAILMRGYWQMENWTELWLALANQPQLGVRRGRSYNYYGGRGDGVAAMLKKLKQFRRQVLRALACLPDGQWLSLQDVWDILHPIWPRFDQWAWEGTSGYVERNSNPSWFLARNGRLLDTSENKANWNAAQGAFIHAVITGPLHWLGLADLTYEYGALKAFRLRGLADLWWDRVEALSLTKHPPIEIALEDELGAVRGDETAVSIDGLTITLKPTAVSAQAHSYLDGLAILEEANTDGFVYRVDVTAVHAAFEEGETLDNLLANWEKWMPTPMPKEIQKQLTTWWESYGQVHLYENVTVIEFGDDHALMEMKALTSLGQHLIAEISPRLVIIPEDAVEKLVAELEKADYTPKQADRV